MAPDTDSPTNNDLSLQWSGRLSLTRRILAVNILVLALLIGGFFYLDSYRARIVDARLEQSERELTLLAISLDRTPQENWNSLIAAFARQTDDRVRLYGNDGRLIADSFSMNAPHYELRDPNSESWERHVARWLDQIIDRIVWAHLPPNFAEPAVDQVTSWPELVAAQQTGQAKSIFRYAPDRTPMISAAISMGQNKPLLLATENARDITRIVRAERFRLGVVLAVAIIISVLLSLFLARTIVRPLRRLARAAVRVRLGRAREVTVPRLPSRRDEIGLLARALSDMSHALRQRIDATEAFAADVTHELKNPIASLRSALEALGSVEAPNLRSQLMDIANDDVRRLDRLVTDIAEASRVDAQLSRAKFDLVDVGLTIERLIVAREARGIPRGVRLVFARPRRGVAVMMGDEQRLLRVIENLVDNAISFSPPGGLVQITATRVDDDVLISVEDEGPGVPESERETIFRRFHSVRPNEEEFGKHSGLGLAIARSIVEGHHGAISIGNRDDRSNGARFVVRLPAGMLLADDSAIA
ncbi:sensor histidine kinase [Rhizorhapis sp. SPR117]|uniref:sensor histidine kinase n=1 Tax=Rhizorhapis sp. SPR117 TaxID=2912611 RepID=UPI001F45ECF9|nr:stimulus-sensing domain-containing protein [Rhizorhapis sp. SPR117]